MIISSTAHRVPDHTSRAINDRIRGQTRRNVERFVGAPPAAIDRRLRELDEEWDIERVLETNASIAMLTGIGLAISVDRRWLALSGLVAGFLFQHAIQGWCPPIPILRRMGLRTSYEIDEERYALKLLRGDFAKIETSSDADVEALERFEGEGGLAYEDPPSARRETIDVVMSSVLA